MEVDISAVAASDHEKQEDPIAKQDASSAAAVDTGAGTTVETPRVSMMAKVGSNFVIPKNKALVPVTRTTTKWEPLDPKKEELKPLSRKTKWGPDLTEDPVVKRGRALALQTRAEQLAAQLESNNLEIDNNEATRSPSPPPLYDAMGHRMNTREGRKRDQLDLERREAIGECMKLNPFYKPPAGYRPVPKEAKLFIPVKENPGYNFIGLILGPRGNTQKRLEADTGCKITIRGKGSIKEGKTVPYRYGKDNDGAFEDLHVHIAAETYEKVDAAVAIIEPLLIPVDEDRNIYKMKQLRELAEMNGTVRDFLRICTLCGEEGHREWQCPKDKLQTFQAKVICRLCGDGSHPTIDCPLKHSGQGKAIDKEYLSFLEELGAGLGGIDPPAKPNLDARVGADTSQPMLLTASGAQPMPSTWMGSESDNASDIGGFPRFPFPFPFPPGPQGMNAMNFLPRLFNPAFFGLFRGRPLPPPSLQMMAFMLSAFRGRFPFPPFGLRPNMMRPPMPSPSESEGPSMDNSTSGQHQTPDLVADGVAQNNFEPPQNYSEFLPPSISTFDSDEKQHSSVAAPVISSAEAPSFPSSSLLPVSAPTASPVSKSPPPFETATNFPSAGNLGPIFPSVSTPNMLLPEVPYSGHTVPPVTPSQPVVPTFRPVPSVRPVIPPVAQSPSFSHLRGPGLAPPVTPSWVGTSNISSLSSLDNLSKPSQTWPGSATWSQNQVSMEASSTSPLNKPASDYTCPQFFPKPSTITPVPPRIDTPYSFNSSENPTLLSTAAGSGPLSFPPLHPPSVSSQFGYLTPRSISFITPAMPPSITPGLSNTAQGQLGVAIYNQQKDNSLCYPDSRLGLPPAMGSPFRAGGLVNATQPGEDYHLFSSVSEHSKFSQKGLPAVFPPDASRLQMQAHDYQRGSPFSASEFSYARPQEPLYGGSHVHAEARNVDVYNAGRIENQELRGSAMMPPSEVFGRNYRYDPSIPMHLLQQRGGSMYEPWNANLPSSRP